MNKKPLLVITGISILTCAILLVGICVICGISASTALTYNQNPYIEEVNPIFSPSANGTSIIFSTSQATSTDYLSTTISTENTSEVAGKETITPKILQTTTALSPKTSKTNYNDTLNTFEQTIVPISDPLELAFRLEGKQNLPEKLEAPAPPLQVGNQDYFWVMDTDTNENFQVLATLEYVTDHVYFWIENEIMFKGDHLKNLAETFENKIYPTNRSFFGEEWIPGVDADPHLYILFAKGLGSSVAGYFSTIDEYLALVREYSNAHEMFFLNSDHLQLNQEYTYSVLAHEFQHMIHWKQDRNEETWMNEGFSNLAVLLNGYSIGGADRAYAEDPDIQLNDWPNGPNRSPYYGASFLFMTYFLDRFGEQATQALVSEPTNGMVSIDKILSDLGFMDDSTNEEIGADDVFSDWVVASYLQDPDVLDGRYTYHNYAEAPKPSLTEEIGYCPQDPIQTDVNQYGVDYIRITCPGDYFLDFEGISEVSVIPINPYSGNFAFYSNRGDESDMTLTKEFDFTHHNGALTLSYWTWYDLEEDYDYLYLLASTDNKTWQILITPSGTPEDPSGNSYGWAYNGVSSNGISPEWIKETVDISQFAGEKVLIRFEYITDAAVNGEGFLVDDIQIPEIDYETDFENENHGWLAEGFVRIQNALPQTFRLSLIRIGQDITVEKVPLASNNNAQIPLHIGTDFDEVILVVSGATRYTRQRAQYTYSITK